jgi:putative transposase
MINQHFKAVMLPEQITQRAIGQSPVPKAIAQLQEFIALRSDAPEVRKALAVKLIYQAYKYFGNSDNSRCVTLLDNRLETSL